MESTLEFYGLTRVAFIHLWYLKTLKAFFALSISREIRFEGRRNISAAA
jgi:hypothetical protein